MKIVQLNVLHIAKFLNEFDINVRSKLAVLNEKLNKLERAIEYFDAASHTSTDKDA